MLLEGHHIGHELARMRLSVSPLITGTVAYLAISRSFSSTVVRDHDDVDVAGEHACGVGDGLAAPQLSVACGPA